MADIIIPWDGEHASIPGSWTRYTAWDSKYPKASSADLDGTGGAATHTHTSPSHTHTYASNAHTHATGSITGGATAKTNGRHQDAPTYNVAGNPHTHNSKTSGAFASSSISAAISSIGTGANEYSRYHLIFIKGSVFTPLPADALIMRNDTDSRSSSTHFDDMNGRYMKGASVGADAGSGTDVTTHNHTQSHSHTTSHTHGNVSSGNVDSGMVGSNNTGGPCIEDHSHTVSFTAKNTVKSNNTAVPAATADPSYRELHFWKTSSQQALQTGDIALSIEAETPVGWTDLGWNDVYIKGKTDGGALSTGGSNTHTHTGLSHNHTGASHTHPWSASAVGDGSRDHSNLGAGNISGGHSHSGTTSSSTDATTGTASATFSTDNIEPLYVKAKYIEFQYPPVLPNPILNMMIDTVENND